VIVAATTAPSSVVLSNVMYLVGAVVLAAIVVTVVVLHHRRPKSIQSNMDTFHRGLAALAPEPVPGRRRSGPVVAASVRPRAGGVTPRSSSGAEPG